MELWDTLITNPCTRGSQQCSLSCTGKATIARWDISLMLNKRSKVMKKCWHNHLICSTTSWQPFNPSSYLLEITSRPSDNSLHRDKFGLLLQHKIHHMSNHLYMDIVWLRITHVTPGSPDNPGSTSNGQETQNCLLDSRCLLAQETISLREYIYFETFSYLICGLWIHFCDSMK